MELNHLPIIDWELGTKLAGNKEAVARELIDLLLTSLPKDVENLQQLQVSQNRFELLKQVHKLHGAVCYCGLPRLRTILRQLESDLKNHVMENIELNLNQLDREVKLLVAQHQSI